MSATLFINALIFDGSGAEPYAGSVLVEGARIKTVARGGETAAPDGAAAAGAEGTEVVDAAGATVMPGMVEPHAHPSFGDTATLEGLGDIPPEEHTLMAMKHARMLLEAGFTSICCAAAAKPRLDVVIRNAIEAGDIPGPRMLAATPELTVTGGLGDVSLRHLRRESFALVCDGAEEFRRTAREMCREGVDILKINPSGDNFVPYATAEQTVMNDDEVAAVAEVAASRGKRMAAHARSAESVKMSLRHNVEIIHHATLADAEARDMLEAHKDRVFVCPTIGVTYTTLYEAGDWGVSEEIATGLGLMRELELAIAVMKDLKARGVRVLPGGDYGFAWNPIGANARDLEYFVDLFGFAPCEALHAATALGGQIMGMGHELGLVKEGFLADLLLVDGNPAQDVTIMQDQNRLLAIMQEGRFHKRPRSRADAAQVAAE